MSNRRLAEEVVTLSVEDWNAKKLEIEERGVPLIRISNENDRPKGKLNSYFMIKGNTTFFLWTNEGGLKHSCHIVKYICRADDDQSKIVTVNTIAAYRRFRQYYHDFPDRLAAKDYNAPSMGNFCWFNPCYEDQMIEAVSYDINSAFLWGMKQDLPVNIPSTTQLQNQPLREGNIGISIATDKITTEPNTPCSYQWNKGKPEGIQRWADTLYKERYEPNLTPRQKAEKKQEINVTIGYLQNKCWPLRYAAISHCNERIKQLAIKLKYKTPKKSPLLYISTDSIVIRKEFEQEFLQILAESGLDVNSIGNELGQFKVDHRGTTWYMGNNHKWFNDQGELIEFKRRGPHTDEYLYKYSDKQGKLVNLLDLI